MQMYHDLHSNPSRSLPSQLNGCNFGLKQQPADIYAAHPEGKHSRTWQRAQVQQQQDTTSAVSASISFLSTFLEDASVKLGTVDNVVPDSSRQSIEIELLDELLQALQDEASTDAMTSAMPAAVPAAANACSNASLLQRFQLKMGAAKHDGNSGTENIRCSSYSNARPDSQSAAAMPSSAQPPTMAPSPFAYYSIKNATFSQQQLQQIIDEEMQRMAQAPAAPAAFPSFGPLQRQQQQHQLSLQVTPQSGPWLEDALSPCTLLSPTIDSTHTGSQPSVDDSAASLTVVSSGASSSSSGWLPLQQARTAELKSLVGVCTPCDSQHPASSVIPAPAPAVQPCASAMDFSMQYCTQLVEPSQQEHDVLGSILQYPPVAAASSAAVACQPVGAAMDGARQCNAATGTTADATQQWQQQQQQHGGLGSIMPQQSGHCVSGAAVLGDSPAVSWAEAGLTGQPQATGPVSSNSASIWQRCSPTASIDAAPNTSNKQLQLQQLNRCLVELEKLQQLRAQGREESCVASAGTALHSAPQDLLQLPAPQQIKRARSVPCESAGLQQLVQQSGGLWGCRSKLCAEQQEPLLLQCSQQQQHMARVSSAPCSLAALQQQQMAIDTDQPLLFQLEQHTNGQQLRSRSNKAHKSLEHRKASVEQRRSFEHKVFKPRRPLQSAGTTTPNAAVNLAISGRVKAWIQWQHQQRHLHQLERKLRHQHSQHPQLAASEQ